MSSPKIDDSSFIEYHCYSLLLEANEESALGESLFSGLSDIQDLSLYLDETTVGEIASIAIKLSNFCPENDRLRGHLGAGIVEDIIQYYFANNQIDDLKKFIYNPSVFTALSFVWVDKRDNEQFVKLISHPNHHGYMPSSKNLDNYGLQYLKPSQVTSYWCYVLTDNGKDEDSIIRVYEFVTNELKNNNQKKEIIHDINTYAPRWASSKGLLLV